jgi:hypothetical protein
VIGRCHHDLEEVDANVCVLMATAAKDDKGKALAPAVKLHGVACAATVRIVSYKDRVAGREDAEILVDADLWEEASDPERVALLDHELHHLEVQRDDDGHPKSDDCGRPKLKMRHHDHDFGWFDAIARRHGDASYEVKQAKAFADQNGQLYWGWSSPPAGGPESGLDAGRRGRSGGKRPIGLPNIKKSFAAHFPGAIKSEKEGPRGPAITADPARKEAQRPSPTTSPTTAGSRPTASRTSSTWASTAG